MFVTTLCITSPMYASYQSRTQQAAHCLTPWYANCRARVVDGQRGYSFRPAQSFTAVVQLPRVCQCRLTTAPRQRSRSLQPLEEHHTCVYTAHSLCVNYADPCAVQCLSLASISMPRPLSTLRDHPFSASSYTVIVVVHREG